jgi:hypothetical protein|tara:strand:+ start:358 stop:666 length:309 start_codon:yes stop_codon:yes gene_type:complete
MEYKSSDDVIKDLMPKVVKLVRQTAYIDPNDSRVTDAEVLGLVVSKYLKWCGSDIMETMFSALEDANFHDLNEKLLTTYKDWENEEDPNELDWNNTASPLHY